MAQKGMSLAFKVIVIIIIILIVALVILTIFGVNIGEIGKTIGKWIEGTPENPIDAKGKCYAATTEKACQSAGLICDWCAEGCKPIGEQPCNPPPKTAPV
jgi:hypothetical protein